MPAAPVISPEKQEQHSSGTTTKGGWIVVVYNNNHNTYDQVIRILMLATSCNIAEAEMEAWEIDKLGQSVVHHADQDECQKAASVISTIGIRVEVSEA